MPKKPSIAGMATAFSLLLRLHYKAAHAAGVGKSSLAVNLVPYYNVIQDL